MKTIFEKDDIKVVRKFIAASGKIYKLYDAYVGGEFFVTKTSDFSAAFEAGWESARRRNS